MSTTESQDIEQATTSIQPDSKTRRYDRQLRLWAASGQAALESSRVLVVSASATSCSILKNLVLPGIGNFTIIDSAVVAPSDAGNNFFLNGPNSIGKKRAQEAVPLLNELNESVDGQAVVKSLDDVLNTEEGRNWVKSFTLVIAHNLHRGTVDALSKLLWEDLSNPPLIVVRSAGLLAEFFIQFHEHCIIEPHSDTAPSLRLTRPFPALQHWADTLDYAAIDPTEHAHIPFVVILIKEADKWRAEHNGALPSTSAEKKAFKARLNDLQSKIDEENFEEAEAQAWRMWSEVKVPSDISALFDIEPLRRPSSEGDANAEFHALLQTLKRFVSSPASSGYLPLTSTLPDMKTDTESYVKLQKMYKQQASEESAQFKELLKSTYPDISIDETVVDLFVKNAHHVKVIRGKQFGVLDNDPAALRSSLEIADKETSTHLALSALSALLSKNPDPASITEDALKAEIRQLTGEGIDFPEALDVAVGEIVRAPTADLPNTAAFLGGMVAQEAIKMITKQYIPVNGYCVIDLVDTWTGIVG